MKDLQNKRSKNAFKVTASLTIAIAFLFSSASNAVPLSIATPGINHNAWTTASECRDKESDCIRIPNCGGRAVYLSKRVSNSIHDSIRRHKTTADVIVMIGGPFPKGAFGKTLCRLEDTDL